MDIDKRIREEFETVLSVPISVAEASRYKHHILSQNVHYSMVDIEELYKMSRLQPLTFTPAQIITLWQKSNRLVAADPHRDSRRKVLKELLASALFAEYLNQYYLLPGSPEFGIPFMPSALFNIRAVPKEHQRPDVYIYARNHNNRDLVNLGSFENEKIEIVEYEHYAFAAKPVGQTLELAIAAHVIDKKINKLDHNNSFPYENGTRLVCYIDESINIDNLNFQTIHDQIGHAAQANITSGIGSFEEIYLVHYTNTNFHTGIIVKCYPEYLVAQLNIFSLLGWVTPRYTQPLFEI